MRASSMMNDRRHHDVTDPMSGCHMVVWCASRSFATKKDRYKPTLTTIPHTMPVNMPPSILSTDMPLMELID
jgi:hypothetical protein